MAVAAGELAALRRARDFVDVSYGAPVDVAALARVATMSPAHFTRRFRAVYGETPYQYLMTRRIERAKALLRRDDLSITEISLAVGASSLGSFSRRFTELVGECPSRYRARHRSPDPGAARIPPCWARVLTRPSRNGEVVAASGS
jgi:AraC-like DNA-binding protein